MMYYLYVPYVYRKFKENTEHVYNGRTTNITVSLGLRIQGFENMVQTNSLKLSDYVRDAYNSNSTFPYTGNNQSHPNCTVGVPLYD